MAGQDVRSTKWGATRPVCKSSTGFFIGWSMAIYNWEKDASIPGAIIRDATGDVIECVLECDTVSGRVRRIERDTFWDAPDDEVDEIRPAPLTVEFLW